MVIDDGIYDLCMCVINIPLFYQSQKWDWVFCFYVETNDVSMWKHFTIVDNLLISC